MEKKILITGGTGFIGRPIVEKLLAKNHMVEIITTRKLVSDNKNLQYHYLNLANKNAVAEVVGKIQATHLMHLAWNVKAANFASSTENSLWIDYSMNLARAFLRSGGKEIIGAGTCFEYDFSGNIDKITEGSPIKPNTFYGECKNILHENLKILSKEYNTRLVWGRIFYPYGPREEVRKLISAVINTLKSNQEFVCNTPKNILDYIYVEDVAESFVHLLLSKAQGEFNICSGQGTSVQDILLTIANLLGKSELIKFYDHEQAIKVIGSTDKFDQQVHILPRRSLADGIREYLL